MDLKGNEKSWGKLATLRCHFTVAGRANTRGAPTTRRGGCGTRDAVMGPWLERQVSEPRHRILRQLLQSEMQANQDALHSHAGSDCRAHGTQTRSSPAMGTTSSARADSQPRAHSMRPLMWGIRSFLSQQQVDLEQFLFTQSRHHTCGAWLPNYIVSRSFRYKSGQRHLTMWLPHRKLW